jgi:transaldolase
VPDLRTREDVLFLDSADPADAVAAAELGFVGGMTLNPKLVAEFSSAPLEHLRVLHALFPGFILFQPGRADVHAAEAEARRAVEVAPGTVGVKLPATPAHASLALRFRSEGVRCALTAVYTPGQALLAHQTGCRWIIPYVDRARRLLPDGEGLVGRLRAVLDAVGSDTRILAASVKSPEQAVAAVAAGAHAVSCPLEVLTELARHPLTEDAVAEFERIAAGSVREEEERPMASVIGP